MTKQQPDTLLEGANMDELMSALSEANEHEAYNVIRALRQRVKVLERKLAEFGCTLIDNVDALSQASEPSNGS